MNRSQLGEISLFTLSKQPALRSLFTRTESVEAKVSAMMKGAPGPRDHGRKGYRAHGAAPQTLAPRQVHSIGKFYNASYKICYTVLH